MAQTGMRRDERKYLVMVMISCAIFLTGAIAAVGQDKPAETAPGQSPVAVTNTAEEQSAEIAAVPNRPTFATTAEAVQRGVFEIEYGFEGGDSHQNVNGLLKFGLFKNLELRFANNPIQRDGGVAGRGDSAAGFKYRIFSQKRVRPTVAVLYTAAVPTATAGLGSGAMGHSAQLLVSKDFGKHHFDINEGVQFVGRAGVGGFDRNYFTALSYAHPIKGKWAYTAELAGFSWTNAAAPATMTFLAAPTYSVTPRLVLDGGAYVAVYGNLPRVTYFFGVTYAVGNIYRGRRLYREKSRGTNR
ncbi:MAG: hypothetical protein NVS9B13_26630 [Candidatus Acidiferrum sp.]